MFYTFTELYISIRSITVYRYIGQYCITSNWLFSFCCLAENTNVSGFHFLVCAMILGHDRMGSASVNGRTGVLYTPENLTKTPKIKRSGVRVRPK